jgi:hypothetical protein
VNRKDLPGTSLHRLAYAARTAVSAHPALYLPFARRKYRSESDRIADRNTELVIDGFQRSGNTFAVVAFEMSQARPVRIAHHLHAAAQIIAAVRMGVPTLVLIRDPVDTVLSHMIREPGIPARQAMSSWVGFYEAVVPLEDAVVVADFGDVTTDFGAVIREVNSRFGTSFAEFEHTEENVARCFEIIERRNREAYGRLVETKVPRPSAERERLKDEMRGELEADRLRPLRDRAYGLYRELLPSRRSP